MSGDATMWQLEELAEDGARFRVLRPGTALELARQVLPSKPVIARAFERCQLRRTAEPLTRTTALVPGDEVTLAFWRELRDPAVVLDSHEPRYSDVAPEPAVACNSAAASKLAVPRDLDTTPELAVAGGPAAAPVQPKPSPHPLSSTPLSVVHRDPLLLAIDKPAGILVHGDGTGAATLTDAVLSLLAREGSVARPQAVQRLDVETSGLVLFSLTEEFQPALDQQVAGHGMHKRYLALVRGTKVAPRTGWRTIDAPIGRDRHDARRMRVARGGKPSVTRVRELEVRDGRSLVLVELETGRRHQIRVHLASIGHPIVGDALYGGPRGDAGLMLHAWEERVTHPLSGEVLTLQTAWPTRFDA